MDEIRNYSEVYILLLHILLLQYDPEGFGEIPWNDFLMLLNSSDFVKFISQEKRDILLERARQSNTSAITFQDFVNIVSLLKRLHSTI